MSGAWTFNEDTMEFELQEPYKGMLAEAKHVATSAWIEAMMEWLSGKSGYGEHELLDEFTRRAREQERPPMEIVESFVIEVIEGNL